jgi:hypothetical protein
VKEAVTILKDPLGALPSLSCPDCQNCIVQQKCNMSHTIQIMHRVHQKVERV